MMVMNGLDQWLNASEAYRDRKIALIVNQTSVTSEMKYSWDVLKKYGCVKRIFTPEHGLFAVEQDQIPVDRQPGGMELVSLYGKGFASLMPERRWLEDIDLAVFDIQDIGCRYYTYVNTLMLIMECLDRSDIEMLILDRPNPLGGNMVEGSDLEPELRSFVGILPAPVCHGCTAGELALFYRDLKGIECSIDVVEMQGWKRSMRFEETGQTWVPPSPNMPTIRTATVYPGTCLFEGVNISEGRGTTTPFELIGAPFIQAERWGRAMEAVRLPGISFRPVYFKPTFHKHSQNVCGGLYLHVNDRVSYKPFHTGLALVKTLFELYPDQAEFLHQVYEFEDIPAFDLLCGSAWYRSAIEGNIPLAKLFKRVESASLGWENTRKPYLIYEP